MSDEKLGPYDGRFLTLAELYAAQDAILEQKEMAKRSEEALNAELDRRYGAEHKAALANLSKLGGTITSVLPGGLRLKADTTAKTKWDQPALWAWAADYTREELEHYCKIELTPREAVYKALPPGNNVKGALKAARTDEQGNTKYRLLAEGEK